MVHSIYGRFVPACSTALRLQDTNVSMSHPGYQDGSPALRKRGQLENSVNQMMRRSGKTEYVYKIFLCSATYRSVGTKSEVSRPWSTWSSLTLFVEVAAIPWSVSTCLTPELD